MAIATPTWTPYMEYLGHLPVTNVEVQKFPVNIQTPNVNEIQVYMYVSIQNAPVNKDFHRGYYEIYTMRGTTKYPCFMNVAGVSDTIVNSDNMWLPFGEGFDKNVYIAFHGDSDLIPAGTTVKFFDAKSIEEIAKRRTAADKEAIFAEAYVTGFRCKSW